MLKIKKMEKILTKMDLYGNLGKEMITIMNKKIKITQR